MTNILGWLLSFCTILKIQWTEIKPSADPEHGIPLPRSSHGVSTISDRIYVYGGENVARTPLEDDQSLWCAYKNTSNEWAWKSVNPSADATRPSKRLGHAQCATESKIYVFGGRAGTTMGEKALNDLWELDCSVPGKETWKEIKYKEGTTLPEARSFHKMLYDGAGHLYVFGGCGAEGRLADLHMFDLETHEWTNFGSSGILKGRGGANFLRLEDKLAVIAGFSGTETKDGHLFDISSAKWEESGLQGLNDLRPRSVSISGVVSMPGYKKVGLIFGGEVDPSDKGHEGAGAFANDVVLLDGASASILETIPASPSGDAWPENRGWADGSPGSQNDFYMFGGLTGNDECPQRLGDLWVCNVHD